MRDIGENAIKEKRDDGASERREMRWVVSQVSAREHYAAARAFARKGTLHLFYTDVWCRYAADVLRHGPAAARAFAGRFHPELAGARVVSFTLRTMLDRVAHRGRAASVQQTYAEYARTGRAFAQRVARHLRQQPLDRERHVFFGFDTGCLETLAVLRERGVSAVVDQIDPARVEEEIVFEEAKRWPGWQSLPGRIPDLYYERLAAEWDSASVVLVNSEWSKRALMAQGVPAGKTIVVPLAYETSGSAPPKQPHQRPLMVLWLGSVILRKGIQYLIEAARALNGAHVRFVVAGPVGISAAAVDSAPPNVSFVGRVTRDRIADLMRDADLFVLPTLSDGFAITQIEAMAHCLPVVATPNCGEVVTDGVDGVIVPPRDSAALGAAILRLESDRHLLAEMSSNAIVKSRTFSLDAYAKRVESLVAQALAAS